MTRIIYTCTMAGNITGGIKLTYRHVEALAAEGFDAYVLTHGDSGPDWLHHQAPLLSQHDFKARPGDIIVLPEDDRDLIERARGVNAQRVVFCQNQYYAPRGISTYRTAREAGINHFLASSETIGRYLLERFPGTPVSVVPCYVDQTLFHPREKRLQVCFYARKRALEAEFIIDLLKTRHPDLRETPFVEIKQASEEEVARIMGESAVFLSLSRLEGLGLTPLEAMASGCLVVGFTGVGGREYASGLNGFWTENEDCWQCVDDLARALRFAGTRDPLADAMTQCGCATAGTYSRDAFVTGLRSFWDSFLR